MQTPFRLAHVAPIVALSLALVATAGCKKSSANGGDSTDTKPAAAAAPAPGTTQHTLVGAAGSACSPNGAYNCSPDGLHEVMCVNGTWTNHRACRGPNHCKHDGNNATCDYGPLMPGDTCSPPLAATCTADSKGIMNCVGNRMVVTQTCGGGQTCKKDGTAPACK